MRIGILGLLHESNTFIHQPTTIRQFQDDLLVFGDPMIPLLGNSHHEIGGFLQGISQAQSQEECKLEIVPLMACRAMPAGPIDASTFAFLVQQILSTLEHHRPLDGLLIAAHGAAVSEDYPDADGFWLQQVRQAVGPDIPIVVTIDPHANLSPDMVDACTALIAYRTNPHLDQRQRGIDAAKMLVSTLVDRVRPTMSAVYLPMIINIERQSTDEPHLHPHFELADLQLQEPAVLSNSILLGFPYSDVPKMGSATIAITNDDAPLANRLAHDLARSLWNARDQMLGQFRTVEQAIDHCIANPQSRFCLLDMGDNIGGGSAADGTWIAKELIERKFGPAIVAIHDPGASQICHHAGVGATLRLTLGGQLDPSHGPPLDLMVKVCRLVDGRFAETEPRHGGITQFDQGPTAIVQVEGAPLTILVTSKRMVPFSLQQLISCGINPRDYRALVAKGVHAPVAAYRTVCDQFLRVNTGGSTCADLTQLNFFKRRKQLYPFEHDVCWE